MPLKYVLSRTCAGSGLLFGYDFVTFLGQFLQNHTGNYVCYSAKYIRFIFIKYYWLQSKGNAFEILFVKNLCRVGTTFRLRFYHILGQLLQNNTNNQGFYTSNRLNLYLSRIYGLRVKVMPLKYFLSRSCAGSGRIFGFNFVTFLGQVLQNNNNNYVCYDLRNRFYLYLSRIIRFRVKVMPFKYFLS